MSFNDFSESIKSTKTSTESADKAKKLVDTQKPMSQQPLKNPGPRDKG